MKHPTCRLIAIILGCMAFLLAAVPTFANYPIEIEFVGVSPPVSGCACQAVEVTVRARDYDVTTSGVGYDDLLLQALPPGLGWTPTAAAERDENGWWYQTFTKTFDDPGEYPDVDEYMFRAIDLDIFHGENDVDDQVVRTKVIVQDHYDTDTPISCAIDAPDDGEGYAPGAEVTCTAHATDYDKKNCADIEDTPLTYVWTAPTGGSFKDGENTGEEVTWVAPDVPGTYTITVTADDAPEDSEPRSYCGTRSDNAVPKSVTVTVGIIHVKPGGDDDDDGLTWDTAKQHLNDVDEKQGALAAAYTGGEIWVAAGTYDENITLVDGVGLYGGFAGDETAREQRSPNDHETILDGNKLGSVVTIPAEATSATVVDGFTIQNGIGTLVSSSYYGGGIYCPSGATGSPTISHNRIICNYVTSYGGGIYIGGGLPTITYNYIIGNDTPGYGGGIHLANATADVANNVISANGALRGAGIHCNSGTTTITNNTIALNDGLTGGGIYCNDSVTVTGNIIAYNCSGIYQTNTSSYPTINYNCLHNVSSDYTNVTLGTGNVLGDPSFARIDYGDLHIQPTSDCRNAGSNDAVQSLPTDIEGRDRILNTTVDMGAYESDGTTYSIPDKVYRVIGTDGSDSNDGTDWDATHGMATVQGAIDKAAQAGASVWVKGGTYSAPLTFSEHLALHPFVYLYGGFAGSGSQRGNYTTLDGTNNGRVLAIHGGYGVNVVDGFTMTRGYIYGEHGGGICISNSSPVISHNVLQSNSVGGFRYGGALYCLYGSPLIAHNFFGGYDKGNVAYEGGAIMSQYSAAYIADNFIEYNSAVYGGGVSSWGSATIANNFVYSNHADWQGCGINRVGSGDALIANNTITYNTSTSGYWIGGGGVYVSGYTTDTVLLANNIIAYNRDGIYLNTSTFTPTLGLFKNCVYENRGTDSVLRNYVNITDYGTDFSSNPIMDTLPWRIQSSSPCRDAGNPSYAPSDDIEGRQRDGNPDVGCYEYWEP